ncbi:MAG TPA: 30S ribosomal protein S18 [Opitutae bacterium]|nr:30S ribosomal protein S18 [Opitutae bacterium]|tara:strand:- start:220 stop:414 length:195 start_codon:yes stop_codon:yes gene_type:complete
MTTQEEKTQSRSPLGYNYLDTEQLSRFVTGTGKILPRRITNLSAKEQRHVTRMVKRARAMLLAK